MANGHGGARVGAGRRKKPLEEKILEGNPGKRKLTLLEFPNAADLEGAEMPPARDYLTATQKSGKPLMGKEVYETTWKGNPQP